MLALRHAADPEIGASALLDEDNSLLVHVFDFRRVGPREGFLASRRVTPCLAAAPDPLDEDEPPLLHLVVPASGLPPPRTLAARSVFELPAARRSSFPIRPAKVAAADSQSPRFIAAAREAGTTRCTGGQYPDNRWTAERQVMEEARRAKQRPPKPTRRAKTRGKRLLQLIGDDFYD